MAKSLDASRKLVDLETGEVVPYVPQPGVEILPQGWAEQTMVPWLEAQTADNDMAAAAAQGLALKRMLLGWDACRGVLVIGEHGALDRVDVATIDRIRFCWSDGGDIVWSPWIEQKSALYHAAQMFVRDANRGLLNPSTWCAEWTAMENPF